MIGRDAELEKKASAIDKKIKSVEDKLDPRRTRTTSGRGRPAKPQY
ncbi:MAG: hypothetical protein MZV64_17920 [Ignavibacteriales bacterium]|nr:hypothetical protein [Ignavibacteriales bacterium]